MRFGFANPGPQTSVIGQGVVLPVSSSTLPAQHDEYQVAYLNGLLTVQPTAIPAIRQQAYTVETLGNTALFIEDVRKDSLLIAIACQRVSRLAVDPSFQTYSVSDSQGNSYTRVYIASSGPGGGEDGGRTEVWTAIAGESGPCTITVTGAVDDGDHNWQIYTIEATGIDKLDPFIDGVGQAVIGGGAFSSGEVTVESNSLVLGMFQSIRFDGNTDRGELASLIPSGSYQPFSAVDTYPWFSLAAVHDGWPEDATIGDPTKIAFLSGSAVAIAGTFDSGSGWHAIISAVSFRAG